MTKIKIITIILGLFLTTGSVTFGLVYKRNMGRGEALGDKVEQSRREEIETKANEPAETSQVLEISEIKEEVTGAATVKESVVYEPPINTPLVDIDPIVKCGKGRCEAKSIKQSECVKAVCCEIQSNIHKWTTDVYECRFLIYENISVPETKPVIVTESLDETKTVETERIADESESCQRLKDMYASCTEEFNKNLNNYTDCQERNSDAAQRYEDETQKYSNCIDNHNDKSEEYNKVEWEYSQKMTALKQEQIAKGIFSSGVGAKARQDLTDYYERKLSILKNSIEIVCVESSPPIPEYCSKPTNSCTKPNCL